MSESIQPLIALANTDRELQALIHLQRHLEQQIKKARAEVDKQLKLSTQKKSELQILESKRKEIQTTIQTQEQLIDKLEAQVPMIRNEKEFVTSKNQLEEARKGLGVTEEKLLEMDIRKEELEAGIDSLKEVLDQAEDKFNSETAGLFTDKEKAEKKITKLKPKQVKLLGKIPKRINTFYDRCLESGVTTPICAIEDKSCGGCHMVLLPQMINELMGDPNSFQNCPYCSRLLFYPEETEEETSKA